MSLGGGQRPVEEGVLTEDEVEKEQEAKRDANSFVTLIPWNFYHLDTNPTDL